MYSDGIAWELEKGGLFNGSGGGTGGGGQPASYTALDNASQDELAALGIRTE